MQAPAPVTNKVIKLPTLKLNPSHLKTLSNKSIDKVYVSRKDTANKMWKETPRKSKIDQIVSIPSLTPMSPVPKTERTKRSSLDSSPRFSRL